MKFALMVLFVVNSTLSTNLEDSPILWREGVEPYFLPESILSADQPDRRLDPETFWKIRSDIAERAKSLGDQHCFKPVRGDNPATESAPDRWPTPSQKIAAGLPAFVGTVKRIAPGWLVPAQYPISLVEVEVEEILQDGENRLRLGDRLLFDQDSARLMVDGAHLCTEDRRYSSVQPDDRILVIIGSFDERNPQHILTSAQNIYPIVSGCAQVRGPWPSDRQRSFLLEQIRNEIPAKRRLQ